MISFYSRKGIGATLLILAIAIGLSLMLVGGIGITSGKRIVQDNSTSSLDEENQPTGSDKSLQLRAIKFLVSKPLPATDCGEQITGTREPEVLWAVSPDPGGVVTQGGLIKAFYNDEWPLTLGEGNISPVHSSPDHIAQPNVGDISKRYNGLPVFPSIFISDITSDPNNQSGDAQKGGSPNLPYEIWGTWKSKGGSNIKPANKKNLGGPDTFPSKSNTIAASKNPSQLYTSEIIWRVDDIRVDGAGLTPGHTYRAQIIIHDGDNTATGGDVGQTCVTIKY